MQLSIYDPYEDYFNSARLRPLILRHLASELLEAYGFDDKTDLDHALSQAFDLCLVMDIPISEHFKKIYLYEGDSLTTDWLLSDLGSYLLLINGNARNPFVARARMYVYSR